jgi:hypothetical protein
MRDGILTPDERRGLAQVIRDAHREACQTDQCDCVTKEEHERNLRPRSKRSWLRRNWMWIGLFLLAILLLVTGDDPVRQLVGKKYSQWVINIGLISAIIIAFFFERRRR